MIRIILVAILSLAYSQSALGHFVFIVAAKDGKSVNVVMSESLEPDEAVSLGPVAKLKLQARGNDGKDSAVLLTSHDHHLSATGPIAIPEPMQHIMFGSLDYGVTSRDEKSFLLKYHPKAIIGAVPVKLHRLKLPKGVAEIVPERVATTGVRFRVLFGDVPAAKADVTVLNPDGTSKKVTTDGDGWTPAFTAAGRYGVWARVVEEIPGEHEGKKYEQVRHYPTLVFDYSIFPPLAEAVSSFGAAVVKDHVYVYGGHRAKVHTYDTNAVTGAWRRLSLSQSTDWEDLPSATALQGLALVAHNGKLIRVGGMAPQNAPGEKTINRSTDVCAIFDPATNKWEPFPSLPKPRSSHDAVVVGDLLVVVGGWNMLGPDDDWFDDVLTIDLKQPATGWKSHRQPFYRRALQAAAFQNRVYVAGGLDDGGSIIGAVSIYDPAANSWTDGPELPGGKRVGFNPAICVANNRLYVSVADGVIGRLSTDGKSWEPVAKVAPRIVHRMVAANDNTLLLIGGATKGDNLETVEAVKIGK